MSGVSGCPFHLSGKHAMRTGNDKDHYYVASNNEFSEEIKEEDLFENSSLHGHFTLEYGVLIPNYERSLQSLINSRGGRIWFSMGRRMRSLVASNRFVQAIQTMEIIDGDERACPDDALHIASSILACLTRGYRIALWRNNTEYEPAPALEIPWTRVSFRLGRKETYFSIEDFINICRPIHGPSYRASNLELLTPVFGSHAEAVLTKLFCEANVYLQELLEPILALCRGEWDGSHLCSIIHSINGMSKMMAKAVPDTSAGDHALDPIDFATAIANSTSRLDEERNDVPALSGTGSPIFLVLDHLIGRESWTSQMGHDSLRQLKWMPRNWKRFIEFLRQKRLFDNVPSQMEYLWLLLKDSYCGERGWLGRHKYRAFQFIELASTLGGGTNTGDSSGGAQVNILEQSRCERDHHLVSDRSSYKTCIFKGHIHSVQCVSHDRLTQLVTIESKKPLLFHVGDHVAIVMKNLEHSIQSFATTHNLDPKAKLSIAAKTLTQDWKERLDFAYLEYTVHNVLLCGKLKPHLSSQSSGNATKKSILTLDSLCRVLEPEEPRLYSFASIHPKHGALCDQGTRFDLLVTLTGPGGCSEFLLESQEGREVSFGISTAAAFEIPNDNPTRPLVVIAAGSGLGTYLPMLVNHKLVNPKYAFLAFRNENTVPYLNVLENDVVRDRLQLFVELSRDDITLVSSGRKLLRKKTSRRYIDALMMEKAVLLRELATPQDEGGLEGTFYVCGNNKFFATIHAALNKIDNNMVERLVESNRLHLEVQARGGLDGKDEDTRAITLAEMCFHNKANDLWTAIHGKVYDLTDYLPWHPGGRKIIEYVGGIDGTKEWDLVSHNKDRMVYSQLRAYEVGPFVQNESSLNKFLASVTRWENCATFYMEEEAFDNLCESYGHMQRMVEAVFGEDFVKLLFTLFDDNGGGGKSNNSNFGTSESVGNLRRCVLYRIWFVNHGRDRRIADRLYRIAPITKGRQTALNTSNNNMHGKITLRGANEEERLCLKDRLLNLTNSFFHRCKSAIANVVGNKENEGHESSFDSVSRMLYRLVLSYETFYSSLSRPFNAGGGRGWNTVRRELFVRKTFMLRFREHPGSALIPDILHQQHESSVIKGDSLDLHAKEIVKRLHLTKKKSSQRVKGVSSVIIKDWFDYERELSFFKKLDKDNDGLITKDDCAGFLVQDEHEKELLARFMEAAGVETTLVSFNFVEFMSLIPAVAKRRELHNLSSILFEGDDDEGKKKPKKEMKVSFDPARIHSEEKKNVADGDDDDDNSDCTMEC